MTKNEMTLLQTWISFWGMLIMSELTHGWWSFIFGASAVLSFIGYCVLDKRLYPPEPREGFWSKVWRR